ncbi:MAG TPA: hypothetical protein PK511_08910 [Chitinophagales bacterium]|nr:hypothetical protein [Chitinophagales bacterium]HMU69151.1 hypothetical protein [Chitinophagales bacterium]HMZ89401.1 hypothetical protein [Chitinophagales bacterium]HNE46764.1 hypothetical protein [Chitinophagales bacterium]HNF68709.1 hypothetical protein [Chitinophagales bacterium]
MELFWQILGYIIPALVVFGTTYMVIRAFLDREHKMRLLEFRQAHLREALPVRLQAYERLTLFIERISLNNLLPRVRKQEMNVSEFRTALINNIRLEYEHNLSQQVYVSVDAWNMIRAAKEETISVINRNAMSMLPELPGVELHKKIIAELAESEEEATSQKVLVQLKKEVMQLYGK